MVVEVSVRALNHEEIAQGTESRRDMDYLDLTESLCLLSRVYSLCAGWRENLNLLGSIYRICEAEEAV